jgi:hypothetical protein
MVMTIFGKWKNIFLEMDKFQWWIVEKDVEWVKNVGVLGLLII